MARRFVEELADGENLEEVYLVAEKQLRANRNGNLYLQLDLADRTGTVNARMWNSSDSVVKSFEVGDFLFVRGKVQQFQGGLQVIVSHLEVQDGNHVDLTDYLPHTTHDIDKLLGRLRGWLLRFRDPNLRALAECYLMDDEFVRDFSRCPAGIKVHHAYVGGLLEHVVTMMDIAEKIAPLYPDLDREMLLMGVFLHDLGKTRELNYARSFGYSDEGQLLGHLAIGMEMLQAKANKVPELTGSRFPNEMLLRLKHMILSHHGTPEFGAVKVPMTTEAVALHMIDTLDTRIHITAREIRDDRNTASAWTPFNHAMARKLYKGGKPDPTETSDDDD